MSPRERRKDYCFNVLVYCTVFLRKVRDIADALESSPIYEMKEASETLFYQSPTGVKHTSKCKLHPLEYVWTGDYAIKSCSDISHFVNGRLFKQKFARQTFKKCL